MQFLIFCYMEYIQVITHNLLAILGNWFLCIVINLLFLLCMAVTDDVRNEKQLMKRILI